MTDHQLRLTLIPTTSDASCPRCHALSTRVHSRYTRTVADLPWADYQVFFSIHVRRFFCSNAACTQRIFAESCGALLPRSARRTARLTDRLRLLAFATTGQDAARIAHHMAIPISPRTLLRIQHATPDPPPAAPEQVGIDDWAWKKGRTYGTICVDLARRCPIDLLPDRDASSVAQWLQQHPTVQVVTRDRGPVFIEGAARGAPQATHVADRWHLMQNLGDALETVFAAYPAELSQAAPPPSTVPDQRRHLPKPRRTRSSRHGRALHRRYQRRVTARYHAIHRLHAHHLPIARIARRVGVSRKTVYRYLRMATPPAPIRLQPRHPAAIEPYKAYLIERWNAGDRNAAQMWRELRAQGATPSLRTVTRYVETLRHDSGRPRSFRAVPAAPIYQLEPTPAPPLSARQARALCLCHPAKRTAWQTAYYSRLCTGDGMLAETLRLSEQFLVMLRHQTGEHFAGWLEAVHARAHAGLKGFATSLQRDQDAVQASLTLPWSNGQTEAQVQRLKMIKRQMYGRAGFDLLRKRILYRQPPVLRQMPT